MAEAGGEVGEAGAAAAEQEDEVAYEHEASDDEGEGDDQDDQSVLRPRQSKRQKTGLFQTQYWCGMGFLGYIRKSGSTGWQIHCGNKAYGNCTKSLADVKCGGDPATSLKLLQHWAAFGAVKSCKSKEEHRKVWDDIIWRNYCEGHVITDETLDILGKIAQEHIARQEG